MKLNSRNIFLITLIALSSISITSTSGGTGSVDQIVSNQVPYLDIIYSGYGTDHDGDLSADTIRADFTLISTGISGWVRVYMEIWKYDTATTTTEYYIDQVWIDVYVDSINPNVADFLEFHLRESGDFQIALSASYDTASVYYVSQFYGFLSDTTPFPVIWNGWVNLFNNDPYFGNDSYQLGINLDFYEFYDDVEIRVWLYHTNGSYISSWYDNIHGENSSQGVEYSGVFPYDGDYYFSIDVWDGREYTYQTVNVFTIYGYALPYVSVSSVITEYDWNNDPLGQIDTLDIYLNLNFVNLSGQYTLIFTVKWWDGFNWIFLDLSEDRILTLNGFGSTAENYQFYSPHAGRYQIEISMLFDGYSENEVIEWTAPSSHSGSGFYDYNVNWWSYDDGQYNNQDDTVEFEFFFKNNWVTAVVFDYEINIFKYDNFANEYQPYSTIKDSVGLLTGRETNLHSVFRSTEEGDYHFTVRIFVDGDERDVSYADDGFYLGVFEERKGEVHWEFFVDERDEDRDGKYDHAHGVVRFDYQDFPPSDVEIFVFVEFNGNGNKETVFNENPHFEGFGDFEKEFDYRADEDGEYRFIVDIFVNGEHFETRDYYWDGHRYDPNFTPSDDPIRSSDESSATPDLPLPAGNFYLFALALLSSAILITRKRT